MEKIGVLWVEDNPRVRAAARRLCDAYGLAATFEDSAEDAIFLLASEESEAFSAVVSDFALGSIATGADVLDAAERAEIPVRILCSSGQHTATEVPAATTIVDKMQLRRIIEEHLVPLRGGDESWRTRA